MIERIITDFARIGEMDIWVCLLLFLVYGVFFEMLSVKFLSYFRDFKSIGAANITVLLFFLNLWGLGEALTSNIFYAIPIAAGSWIGTVIQVRLEKRNSEKDSKGRDRASCGEEG